MKKLFIYTLSIFLFFNIEGNSKENFFLEAKNKYDEKKLDDSKFLFQRNIVFNPKDAKSYLYLAKIYNFEENENEEFKNLKTTLLLEPGNEEALYMLIEMELKKSNFSKVKELRKKFKIICSSFCSKVKDINESLKNIEAKNESDQ
tara:strand:+ start:527 stop:964 length:438 start_codon:yes stop_codon:yes gene_type:complete